MTYQSKVQQPALSLSKGSKFKVLRTAATTTASAIRDMVCNTSQ
jgi:hypothetical protein